MDTKAEKRNRIYLSREAGPELIGYIRSLGVEIVFAEPIARVARPVMNHADLVYCRLKDDEVFAGDPKRLEAAYPGDVIYNGCSTGKYFIHNLKYTDEDLLRRVEDLGLKKVDVKQGYARCSITPVDEESIITYDRGIAQAMETAGIKALLVEPGQVELPGYDHGFLGGTSGRVGDEIIFNGDLSRHGDFERIKAFIEERGLRVIYFEGYPLRDIGSIV